MNDLANVPTRQRTGATPLGWLRAEVDRLFEDFGRPARDLIGFGSALPALDMVRTDKDYVVTAEMPGMKAEDVRITVDDQALIVAGEKRKPRSARRTATCSASAGTAPLNVVFLCRPMWTLRGSRLRSTMAYSR